MTRPSSADGVDSTEGALRMPSNVELRHLEVLSARSAIATFVAWHQLQVEGIHVKMQRSWLAPGCRHGRWQTQQDGGAACAALARARERGVTFKYNFIILRIMYS